MSCFEPRHDTTIDLRQRRVDATARSEGSWAARSTAELLGRVTEILDDLEFSAELAWARLAWVDAALAVVVSRCGTDPDVLDDAGYLTWCRAKNLLVRVESHRAALAALEDDATFAARCAAALISLDGIEVGFDDAAAETHVPAFAEGDRGFLRWRAAVTQGCAPPEPRPDYDALVAEAAAAKEGTRVVAVLDWLDVAEEGTSELWVPQLLAAVLGRHGTFVRVDRPRDAAAALPAVVARFVTVACLARRVTVTSAVSADPVDAMDAVGDALERFADDLWRSEVVAAGERFAAAHRGAGVLHSTLP